MYIRPEEWLEVVRKEYLQGFIRDGGAAVKFIVPTEEIGHDALQQKLRGISDAEGYWFAFVDAAKTGVHMIDQLFHEVARQVDWDDLAFSFVSRIISENGYKIPSQRQEFSLQKIAELNGRDQKLLPNDLKRLLENNLFHDYHMCQEFRIAMMQLCQAQLGMIQVPGDVIKEWLQGELRRISAIKAAPIFQKIARHNARHMLSSLSYWLHLAGKGGLVIVLDISRCLVQRPKPKDPNDASRYYTKATTLDAYEALRQFIDATDESEFCFIAVIAPTAFLQPDDRRGVGSYNALKLRIWDEVRDKHRANPLSSLIRLSPCPDVITPAHRSGDRE
ncbi:MAG: DUF2791 family P-loop domain-containing protein [Deltaproteobacteria bacterium]|nr:DUF2791 family P-loop domain-containing protein [Deltaproteobacteria bacterium]